MTACPCCRQSGTVASHLHPEPHLECPNCGHRWRSANVLPGDYENKSGRNQVPVRQLERKYNDRMASVAPLLAGISHILEIGCAEGGFGARVKARADVSYAGLEISRDAATAQTRLDKVLTRPAAELSPAEYDLLLSFHVLEHIGDIHAEIRHWLKQLSPAGRMLIEVPNASGHPLREWDSHPEHLHFFTSTSLCALLEHAGLSVEALSSGYFESPIYVDCLRIVARRKNSAEENTARLLARFRQALAGSFVVYGIGGDFRNCVLPLLDQLPVAALVDSDPQRAGEQVGRHIIHTFDPARHNGLPILVSSLRFKDEICQRLRAALPASVKLVGLEDIYSAD
ncbi:MAG: class I SAM-dependent methyltransferase [Gammaproteobacteria bacterium]|nr:class I SAM-dependent methyltransferase [Gammaproteobacteria bacterium]MBU1775833.1 class I SAM-dependent methyltransferase [Gammaproteobacteria bacterium]MBU1968447.1 class I SAM-dependent methyltransferase [Gammaproteobacteria bacterium]